MNDSMEGKDFETDVEKVDIVQDEETGSAKNGKSWREEFEVAGGELAGFLSKVMREVNVRRIIVRNSSGRKLLDIPVAVGAIGLLPPLIMWSAIAVGAAVLTNCSVTIVRVEKDGNASAHANGEKEPEETVTV